MSLNLVDLVPIYVRDTAAPWGKPQAVRVLVAANLRREAFNRCSLRGKGNKAAKRAARAAEAAACEEACFIPLTPSEVDRLAELWNESRTFPPRRALVHP